MNGKLYLFLTTLFLPCYDNLLNAQVPGMQDIPEFQCPAPILSRLETHVIKQGETLETIAQTYNLLPETLLRLNPILEQNPLPTGQMIQIPPFNGIKIEVPQGVTWQEIGKAYGVRQEVLFELNGCVKIPQTIFIPGINWYGAESASNDYTGLTHYPLPNLVEVGLNYGWHSLLDSDQKFFHSGVDLLGSIGTSVLSAEEGIVVFIGQEGNYGFLVIINHPGGRQTRYAHLSKVKVKIDDQVQAGDLIGEIGVTGKPDINPPHLHFEVRYQTPQGWITQDPMIHLPQN